MKRFVIGFSMFMLVFGLTGTGDAGISCYWGYTDGSGNLTSRYAGTSGYTLYDFETAPSWTVGPTSNGQIVRGLGGTYANPGLSDATWYLSIPTSLASAYTYTASLGYNSDYFGLYWGSVDTYNSLYLYDNGNLVATITGGDILALTHGASGDRSGTGSNVYVEITGYTFDTIVFQSSQYAFELDNAVTHRVPEPATMLTLGLALLGLVGLKRKFHR